MVDPVDELRGREQTEALIAAQSGKPNPGFFLLDFLSGFQRGLGGKPYSILGAVIGGGGAFLLTPFLHAGTSPIALVLVGATVGLFWKWVLGFALFAGLLAGGYWVMYGPRAG